MGKNVNIKLGANIQDFQSKMKTASKGFKKTAASLKKTGKALTMGLTAPLTAFAAASIKAFDTQAKAEAKLMTALKGNEAAFKSLTTQAQELQKVTIFGDEETMAAQSMLASMGLEEEAIKRLTPLIQDMATAKGMNLSAAADLVAKSVGSSTNALSRYGIQIEGAVGSTERLDSAVIALQGQFKGQAEAAAKAGAGGLKQLQNRFGDLMEQIGAMLIPVLNKLIDWVNKGITAWTNLDSGLKIAIVTLGGVLAAIGPMVTLFGALVSVIGFFLSPLGAVIAGLAALAAAFVYVIDNIEAFKERFTDVSWWKNALISMLQFFVDFAADIIGGYNKMLIFFKQTPVNNPFLAMSDGLEDLKDDTKKYKTEFGSFSRAISNGATKAKKALFGLGSGLGVGGQLSAVQTGESSTVSGSVSLVEMDVDQMEEEAEVIDTTYGASLVALKEKTDALKDATKGFALSITDNLASSFASAVVNGENFMKSLGKIFEDLAKQIAAMIIKAALLAAVFSMIPGLGAAQTAAGGATDFMGLLTGSLTGKASGGSVIAGQPYMVGESGAEMFVPGQSGTIVPNGNMGGGNITGQFVVQGTDLVAAINNQLESDYGASAQKL